MVEAANSSTTAGQDESSTYRCLVVDSGPIIRLTGVSALWKKAKAFYTVPAVIQEIRDAKARQHLENLPFELQTREPSPEAVKCIVDFARQTGDYQSLSSVDIQVLALVYELEKEGCEGDVGHIRTEPKRMLGVGKMELMCKEGEQEGDSRFEIVEDDDSEEEEVGNDNDCDDTREGRQESETPPQEQIPEETDRQHHSTANAPPPPKSWAALVNPSAAPMPSTEASKNNNNAIGQQTKIPKDAEPSQFSDAEEDQDDFMGPDSTADHSAEPEPSSDSNQEKTIEEELQLEFPSLSAAVTVPYEGSDEEGEKEVLDEEERKKRSLQPISKSGKLYNSVPVAKELPLRKVRKSKEPTTESEQVPLQVAETSINNSIAPNNNQSRIIGGTTMSGQQGDVEDDGEGWISTTKEIESLKATGSLDPLKGVNGANGGKPLGQPLGPPICDRTACTTTDFAMQNVLLQMNLELLSVDGMKIKKLKSWVRRCGACYKVYTDSSDTGPLTGKRLFCERCGSDMIQRIACSVDGKTGRLRLHLKKNYRHNLRGTKYSLPKAGSGDRFQGDLLLREDQLLTGTWNQKAKMSGGGKAKAASESIFGRDIAKNVGCHVNSISSDDIQVGFGRRNPNAAKGRERRGKKKKSSNKACGLRRY